MFCAELHLRVAGTQYKTLQTNAISYGASRLTLEANSKRKTV